MATFSIRKRGSSKDLFYLAYFKHDKFENRSSNSHFRIEPPKVIIQLHPSIEPRQQVKIINITNKTQRCFVLPLESDLFKMKFRNQESIAPGLFMTVEIFLDKQPLEYEKFRNSWLKIHCFDDHNLKIPIEISESEPTLDFNIPKTIDFGHVPLCESVSQNIMISPNTKADELYNVTILEPHEDVTVKIIKGGSVNEATYVEVTYYPTSYTTMTTSLMILTQAFENSFPVVKVTGCCKPPEFRDELKKLNNKKAIFLHQCQKELLKRNRIYQEKEAEWRLGMQPAKKQTQGETLPLTVPNRLWWMQKDFVKYPDSKVLLGPLGRTDEEDAEMKKKSEDVFLQDVNKIKQRMKQVQLHCDVINLGMTGNEELLYSYDIDWFTYMNLRTLPTDEAIFQSNELTAIKQRIVKNPEQKPESKIKRNAPCYSWFTRFHPLCKFIQAGRRVIIQNRLARRLHLLKQYIIEMQCPVVEEEDLMELSERDRIKFFGSQFTLDST